MTQERQVTRNSMQGSLIEVKQLGFEPRTVIDVGACLGTFELYETFPESRLILIETVAENAPILRKFAVTIKTLVTLLRLLLKNQQVLLFPFLLT